MSDQTAPKRHKKGDVREDGRRFLQYIKGREYWVTSEDFERREQRRRYLKAQRSVQEKEAERLRVRKWAQNNPDKARSACKTWRLNNPDKARLSCQTWVQKNSEKVARDRRVWREENRDKVRIYQRDYQNRRKAEDPLFKLTQSLRTCLNRAFRKRGFVKRDGLGKILGCDLEHAKLHLESKFQSGMTWENYGLWHIDHIVPLASAKTAEHLTALCHYTNLQPLWAKDNIRKGAKMPDGHQDQKFA